MNDISIPCIKHKCLKYPVCKNSSIVSCDLIMDWLNSIPISYEEFWDSIRDSFPNATKVLIEGSELVGYSLRKI